MSQNNTPAGVPPQELFSARALAAIFVVGILALLGTIYLLVFGDGGEPTLEVRPTTYSSSALGHKALLETLRRLQVPVIVSRFKSGEKAGPGSLMVLLEPDADHVKDGLVGGFRNVPRGLLVLPKWQGARDRKKPSWVGTMTLLPLDAIEPILKETQIEGMVQRVTGTFTIEVPDLGGTIEITMPRAGLVSRSGLAVGGVLAAMAESQPWPLSAARPAMKME